MGTVRGFNILLICGCRLICQLDRLAWSFLVVSMSDELGWDHLEQAHVKAAFAAGYLWLQIAGGVAGDRIGNKVFQVFSICACGAGMLAVPALIGGPPQGQGGAGSAASSSMAIARGVYFAMGVSCGPQHPTGTAMLAKWCLPAEKAWVSSMDAISSIAGSLLSTLVIGVVIEHLGWRTAMHGMSAATFAFLLLFALFASDSPAVSRNRRWLPMSEDEARLFEDAGMLPPAAAAPSRG